MYKDFPPIFDNEEMPIAQSGWSENSNVVENVQLSESGKDLIDVTRYDKLSISVSTVCTSDLAKKYKEFSLKDSIQVQLYDIIDEDYKTREMRIRNFSANRRKDTDGLEVTNAIWEVSFNLEEL